MALRLRRDVQKASYYVWFLGAEEAKGLRGSRIINSVLPYLIDRSRGQEPLKVTLQVSHKGIKILQGSSKHFIPHSAITSSVQTDDIVACVLLLYNPATKCPLHVHAYRCDSESTAQALQQQLQILINRPENQRRFEELENRLGILPAMPTTSGNKSSAATSAHIKSEHSQKQHLPYHQQKQPQQQPQRRLETSPKRFSSSLGSDTGNSTRESECSEEHSGSPDSRSPPMPKPLQQNSELFDSLAAELRAKLNGNGPPILLPPRDYDTVHRSKGNLAAIELRRCRNKLIVGSTTSPTGTMQQNMTPAAPTTGVGGGVAVKPVSSRGSSGIGSDLAPSPERQELNSSSDDERWSNEADNSVIALKPSQIPIERSAMPIVAHHPQLNRKSAMHPPEDSYLRDLPAKPYTPHATTNGRPQIGNNAVHSSRDKPPNTASTSGGNQRTKTPSSSTASWTREDEIKPIIMRPADYDAKFNRVLQAEQKQEYHRSSAGREQHAKLQDTDKYNEINRLLNKKHTRDGESPERHRYGNKADELDDFDDSDPLSDHLPLHATSSAGYRKENLTDKQKFLEYNTQKQSKQTYGAEEPQRYGGRHRYVDPADLPFEQPNHKKYAAVHRGVAASPERSDLGHRTAERQRERPRVLADDAPPRERERERERYSRSSERNPYREPESLPYIQSMEKMMKSAALCYKSYEGAVEPPTTGVTKLEAGQPIATHAKVIQRTKSNPKHEDNRQGYNYTRSTGSGSGRPDYAPSAGSGSNIGISPKDRFKDAKNKFHAMERSGSRHDLTDEKDGISDYKTRRHELAADKSPGRGLRVYDDWSDEERLDDSPPSPVTKTRSRSRDRWEQTAAPVRERDIQPPRELVREREPRDRRDYSHDVRARELPGMRSEPRDIRESRDSRVPREPYTRENRYDQREENRRDMPPSREREASRTELAREHQRVERTRDHSRDYKREHAARRDYTPDKRGEHRSSDYVDHRSMEKQRVPHSTDKYPPPTNGAPISNAKVLSGIPKGYRHSYAEPVFARSGGRVGLAAVNPF